VPTAGLYDRARTAVGKLVAGAVRCLTGVADRSQSLVMDITQAIADRVLVLDGGLGTMLMARGLAQGQPGEPWNVDKPQIVEEIHRQYAEAGADAVTTNTFGASRMKLAKCGLADRCGDLNAAGVARARAGAGPDKIVLGDIGPTGEMREPMGTCSQADFVKTFEEQAEHLDKNDVDALIIETMYDVQEALAALEACRRVSRKPVIACMTFSRGPRGFATMMGDSPAGAMKALVDAGAWAVGSNCSIGSDAMVELAREIRGAVSCLVVIQPNAGVPEVVGAEVRYPEDAGFFAQNIRRMVDLGVNLVGGCCGTTPQYTVSIVAAVRG
jgi:5-methyltetrahydrofolate--homocysteine methyltransferase